MSSNLIPDVISGSSSVDNPRRDHQSGVGNITGMDFINFNWFIFSRTCFGNGEGLMCPESAAETNQEGLAYGFEIKRDGLKEYQQPSASAVRPFDPFISPYCWTCASYQAASGVGNINSLPQLLCDPSIHNFSFDPSEIISQSPAE
ncbi:hypothetical protein DY000_02015079 [Brassica cretica]|uniref:Uncharacterized protein n=1 Tax=Brassica cretica TaxID=69181 RepID=A0ABQ7D3I9_BRACR|nr:hypothetical protein DY000_02015079 [Brassica cretica]